MNFYIATRRTKDAAKRVFVADTLEEAIDKLKSYQPYKVFSLEGRQMYPAPDKNNDIWKGNGWD